MSERLLTVPEAAQELNTSIRFIRRLIQERRVTFVRLGRHVRIPESELARLLQVGTVERVIERRGRVVA